MESLTNYERARSARASIVQQHKASGISEALAREVLQIAEKEETEQNEDNTIIYELNLRMYRDNNDEICVLYGLNKHIIPFRM